MIIFNEIPHLQSYFLLLDETDTDDGLCDSPTTENPPKERCKTKLTKTTDKLRIPPDNRKLRQLSAQGLKTQKFTVTNTRIQSHQLSDSDDSDMGGER